MFWNAPQSFDLYFVILSNILFQGWKYIGPKKVPNDSLMTRFCNRFLSKYHKYVATSEGYNLCTDMTVFIQPSFPNHLYLAIRGRWGEVGWGAMQPDLFHLTALSTNIPCKWARSDLKFARLSSETKVAILGYIPRTYPEVYCSHQWHYALPEMFQTCL